MNSLPCSSNKTLLRFVPRLTAILCFLVLVAACSSTPPTAPAYEGDYLDRAQSQEKDRIRVTAAVPSAAESKAIFGAPLYKRGVQPVWLKIENNRDDMVAFLPVGLDPAYFTPIEAANMDLKEKKKVSDKRSLINEQFFEAGMGSNIPAGGQRSGFVFSQIDEGTKAFNVDVIGD